MARIFISFLGIGPEGEGYDSLTYFNKDVAVGEQTSFVQRAIIEMKGQDTIDKILVLCTHESLSDFYPELKEELVNDLHVAPDKITYEKISRTLTSDKQWELFSLVNRSIGKEDRVIFDFTHGFRLSSIILSAAVGFIQTSKPNVIIEHVFYGQKQDAIRGELIDMKAFYVINEWAHGVDRFISGADMGKLVALASKEKEQTTFSGLNNSELVKALDRVSRTIKDVHTNEIGSRTHKAFEIIQKIKSECRPEEKELLDLILTKFERLNVPGEKTEYYGASYLETQLNFSKMLADHGLFMQAFTVMQELIVSIGMLGCNKNHINKKINTSAGRGYRIKGDVFFSLCRFSEADWKYTNDQKKEKISPDEMGNFHEVEPFYQKLKNYKIRGGKNIAETLQEFVKEMAEYRNGFDHAWTGKGDVKEGAGTKAHRYIVEIEHVLSGLKEHHII